MFSTTRKIVHPSYPPVGCLKPVPGVKLTPQSLLVAVEHIARRLGGDISDAMPILDSTLPDRYRVAAVTLKGRRRADIHHGQKSLALPKTGYIGADQLPFCVFRLQLCGGPYIPEI